MKKIISEQKKEKVAKAYEDYLNNPFADGYTIVAMESKYGMTIDAMREIYEEQKK